MTPQEICQAGNLSLRFAQFAFPYIANAFAASGNEGLRAEFGDVSVLVDSCGGRMITTLENIDGTQISFISSEEQPFGLFHNPSVYTCSDHLEDLSLMVNRVANDIVIAEAEGQQLFTKFPVIAHMLEGYERQISPA